MMDYVLNVVVLLYIASLSQASSERGCLDIHGRTISPGYHYIPGPSSCTLCICADDGQPKFCKSVLCSPPTDCKSFRVGPSCCEFICLDDEMKHADPSDQPSELSLRYIATAISAILLVSVSLFLVYKVRRRRLLRAALRRDATHGLASIGYLGGGAGYAAACEGPGAQAHKRGELAPRGEAPPPYDEAVAQARVDALRLSSEHRSALAAQSAAIEAAMRHDRRPPPHIYANLPRSVQQAATQCYGYDAPLLQPVNPHPNHSQAAPMGTRSGLRMTTSLGASGFLDMVQRRASRPAPVHPPAFYSHVAGVRGTSLHRTIPRLSADTYPHTDAGLSRARLQYLEARRSFHRPEGRAAPEGGRSVPHGLDLAAGERETGRDERLEAPEPMSPMSAVTALELSQDFVDAAARRQKGTILHLMGLFNDLLPAQHRVQMPDLPVPADKPSCMCYTSTGDEGDADEYRSECENCKSANGSRWVLEDGWAETEEEGTQTLQRRAPPASAPPPATATLPQPLTKQRSNPGLSSNWDNWFNVIQDSSSSDED